MSAEKTYLVRRRDSGEREYRLHELTWLWRTEGLPRDAVFRDVSGKWKPVRELVEPLLEPGRATEKLRPKRSQVRHSHWWWWAALTGLIVVVASSMGPMWLNQFRAWRLTQAEDRKALEERAARTMDFFQGDDVVPGMTPEEVRRKIGPLKLVKATGDASLEQWFYRKQVVVFEHGKVIGIEPLR